MKAVIQRVTNASVIVEAREIGAIENGFLIFLGICEGDTETEVEILARKTANLRVFEDENGKMNKSLLDCDYSALIISQFTLCADCKKGNRPSFIKAAKPDAAVPLYELFMQKLSENGVKNVQHGEFGADMKVVLLNDGPVTILYDTDEWK